MSDSSSQNFDQGQHSDIVRDGDFENEDLVAFQHDSKTINIFYSQLTKYSKLIRDSYLFSDVIERFPQEIHRFQEEFQLLPESINLFFQILQQNYEIKEEIKLTYIQCVDLLKISKFLIIRKLSYKIKQYLKSHKVDADFIIQMIQYDNQTRTGTSNEQIQISEEIESMLTSKINDCLSNEKFRELPIEIIYRIAKQSSPKVIDSNKLFDMIAKSLSKFCLLFPFLDLQKLSDDRLEKLYEMYSKSNENTIHCFDYLKCNLDFINEINNRKKNLEKMNDSGMLLQNQLKESEKEKEQLQSQLKEQQEKMKDLENQIAQLQNKYENSEKRLNKLLTIKGQIVASVENGIFINAEIDLDTKGSSLDISKSKVIVSTSDEQMLGSEAYEIGEPITSPHMKATFTCKAGKYYVRCIVFNSEGESKEIVSNPVTTSGNSLTFKYEGKREATKISLPEGQYKLEVWGAKGGDSTGKGESGSGYRGSSTVEGGLGGYSRGILKLKKPTDVYVFVGEQGRPSKSSEGSTTEGGFPDGGGTKTGHYSNHTTVPGTGGGSTSIRIGSDSDYARVIVAGGGGGASGDSYRACPGGFGGGQSGGNCYLYGKIQKTGAGTQTGSTRGLSSSDERHGEPGKFGCLNSEVSGKYHQRCNSGGGGGGGWYGGGSGGCGGDTNCSSGGGGSGWVFTESSMEKFRSGDTENSSKFTLSSEFYLTDVKCTPGDKEFPRPDGNGKERGHKGDGFAKITPL